MPLSCECKPETCGLCSAEAPEAYTNCDMTGASPHCVTSVVTSPPLVTKVYKHKHTKDGTALFVPPPCRVTDPSLVFSRSKNESRCVADTSGAVLNFKRQPQKEQPESLEDPVLRANPAGAPLEKCPTLSLNLVKGEMSRNGSNT